MNGKKRKKDEDETVFKPVELVLNDIASLSEDKILEKIVNNKEAEWESLPVIKRHPGKELRTRLNKIINEHHHHPSSITLTEWIKEFGGEANGTFKRLCLTEYMEDTLSDMEFCIEMEKMRIKNHKIFKPVDLKEFLEYFLDRFELCFNFISTEVGKRGTFALVCNICSFDMLYFCVLFETRNNLNALLKPNILENGNILLRYDFNSESLSKDSNNETKKERVNDNMQKQEYKGFITLLKNVKIDIKDMFYFGCPCLLEGKINSEDARKCINDES